MGKYRQGLEISVWLVIYCFWSQIDITAFYIDFNILMKGRPELLFDYQLLGFLDSKMANQGIIMVATNQFRSNNL